MTANSPKQKSQAISSDHSVIPLEVNDKIKAKITQIILAMKRKRKKIIRKINVNRSSTKNKTSGLETKKCLKKNIQL